jgi:O-antigen/teichoic acid export membrane protein
VTKALERRAVSLGTANAIDYALQFLLPIVLTRALDAESFGRYRLLWLAASTLIAIAPLFMPEGLYYFLPRSDRPTKRLYINHTLGFMGATALVAAWAISEWNPFRLDSLAALHTGDFPLVPVFVFVWIVASLLDSLPTVDERVTWQSRAIVALSTLRTVALGGIALLTHDFVAVLWTLVAFAFVKLALLGYYIATTHGIGGPWLKPRVFAAQVTHAAPFGIAGTFYGLRGQADQWVAATVFPITMFACFSIAAVLGPMVNLFRKSVNHVFLPSMSRLHSGGDIRGVLAMNSRANAMVAMFVFPLLAFVFAFAHPLIALVYTPTYLDAVPVLRLYIVGLVAFVIELNSILLLLKQGGFSLRLNAVTLVMSVALSYWGAIHIGLAGAAIGSISMIFLERAILLRRIARVTGEPVAALQDWKRLAAMLVSAAVAAAIAALAIGSWHFTDLLNLTAGAIVMAIAYPAAMLVMGQGRMLSGFFHSVAASERVA